MAILSFVFSEDFTFSLALHCIGIFCPVVTFFDLSERQVSLASQTLSVSVAIPIEYQMQVLKAIGVAEQNRSGL